MTENEEKWAEFCATVLNSNKEYRELLAAESPESEPYKNAYSAAKLQAKLIEVLETFKDGTEDLTLELDGASAWTFHTVMGRSYIRRGLALAETDLLHDAHNDLRSGLEIIGQTKPCQDPRSKMAALLSLGVIASGRTEHGQALTYFGMVEHSYAELKEGAYDEPVGKGMEQLETGTDEPDWFEEAYTRSLFYRAQVHQNLHEPDQAADCCAKTLHRQSPSCTDFSSWIQNAAQLSCYYVSECRYAEAHHMLNAAAAMLERAQDRGIELKEDTAPNVSIGWARYYLARLEASASHLGYHEGSEQKCGELPESLRFEDLNLPGPEALPWGKAAVAADFTQARELFNACVPHLRTALQYYQLDGWVTDHVQLLFDVSQAYSCLAHFETDAHRACVMHRQRVKQFADVEGSLSFDHYCGLVRSIDLEIAQAYRSVWELKCEHDWPSAKVLAAAREANRHYHRFLNSFRQGPEGLPCDLEEEWETPILNACIAQARLLTRLDHVKFTSNEAHLRQALELLDYTTTYTKQHKIEGFKEKADLSEQLTGLVQERLRQVAPDKTCG